MEVREPSAKYLVGKSYGQWSNWREVKLGDAAAFKTGPFGSALHKSDYVFGGVPIVNPMQIEDGRIRSTDRMSVAECAADRLSEFRLHSGDVVIGRRGEMGRCAFVEVAQHGWLCGTGSMIIRCGPELNARFVQRLLSSNQIVRAIENASVGTTMINLNQSTLGNLVLHVPADVAEQSSIADALTDTDALIDSLEQLLIKKRQIKQGAMQELLTGRRRLPGFIHPWQTRRLNEVADPVTRINRDAAQLPVITCSKHRGFVDSLGFFKNQVFSNDTSTYKVVLRGQIAYPANHIEEGSIGYQDLYDAALVSPIYVVFQPRLSINGKFLHRLLKLPQFLPVFGKFTSSSVDRRGSLRWPAFCAIEVTLPTKDEQLAVVEVIEALEDEVVALASRLTKARAHKQGMAQALLTGRIRLLEPTA